MQCTGILILFSNVYQIVHMQSSILCIQYTIYACIFPLTSQPISAYIIHAHLIDVSAPLHLLPLVLEVDAGHEEHEADD